MPRFSLREFTIPDYASHIPQNDPRNAIWPRISELAKMLNDIPWPKEEKSELSIENTETENERLKEQEAQRQANEHGLTNAELGDYYSNYMKGYRPFEETITPEEIEEGKQQAYDDMEAKQQSDTSSHYRNKYKVGQYPVKNVIPDDENTIANIEDIKRNENILNASNKYRTPIYSDTPSLTDAEYADIMLNEEEKKLANALAEASKKRSASKYRLNR